jgi:site-specific recombinase XerC
MREAAKAAEVRVVGSGREMPPVVVGRRSWKAVREWSSERSRFGLMRRMDVAMAVAAAVCAASTKVGSFGAEGREAAVRDGGVRRR